MITEDYVNFETAKLLKEKGFEGECFHTYFDDEHHIIAAPTLQMVIKWLREEKGIAVIPVLSSVLDNEKFLWDIKIVVAETHDTYSQGWIYEKQEVACEAAIKYCLKKLI